MIRNHANSLTAICFIMLVQMEDYVRGCFDSPEVVTQGFYNAPEELGALLHDQFGPQLHDDLKKLATKVVGLFHQHCTISRLEEQFEVQAQAMPEKEQNKFRQTMAETITNLRRAANTGQQQPTIQHEREQPVQPEAANPVSPAAPSQQKEGENARPSVKVKLKKINKGQSRGTVSVPKRGRTQSQR